MHTFSTSPVSCSIDLTAPGKHIGHLSLPKITNTAGWASSFVHIASIGNGKGPTILVLAGNHGDEYEGQVAALRLIQELQPEQVSGRIIVVPVLSPAAAKVNKLQPIIPGPPRRSPSRAAGGRPHPNYFSACGRRHRHALRRAERLVSSVLAHARGSQSCTAQGNASRYGGVEQ